MFDFIKKAFDAEKQLKAKREESIKNKNEFQLNNEKQKTNSFEVEDIIYSESALNNKDNGMSNFLEYNKMRKNITSIAENAMRSNFILVILLAISIIMNVIFGFLAVHPVREYFAGENGRYIRLQPLNKPYASNKQVIQFVADGLRSSFTLDFMNYKSNLENAREYYTKEGFRDFLENLKNSKYIAALKEEKAVITSITGTGSLYKEGKSRKDNIYRWYVEIPIEIIVENYSNIHLPQKFIASVVVKRVSNLDNINGIGIESTVLKSE